MVAAARSVVARVDPRNIRKKLQERGAAKELERAEQHFEENEVLVKALFLKEQDNEGIQAMQSTDFFKDPEFGTKLEEIKNKFDMTETEQVKMFHNKLEEIERQARQPRAQQAALSADDKAGSAVDKAVYDSFVEYHELAERAIKNAVAQLNKKMEEVRGSMKDQNYDKMKGGLLETLNLLLNQLKQRQVYLTKNFNENCGRNHASLSRKANDDVCDEPRNVLGRLWVHRQWEYEIKMLKGNVENLKKMSNELEPPPAAAEPDPAPEEQASAEEEEEEEEVRQAEVAEVAE
tara:strand:+ start:588 stop:1460 length:873 start_codon:yes stop_codon:yes gene_type:complete